MNLAAIWDLPVVFICENNLYGEFTAASDVVAGEIYKRAEGYGIPGVRVDGQDVVAVNEATQTAVERARAGEGPTLIEAMTYRWYGHFYGEEALTGNYRNPPDEEIADWKKNRDPVKLTRERILQEGLANEAELDAIDKAIDEEMESASQFAQQSPEPPPEQALDFLYSARIPGPPTLPRSSDMAHTATYIQALKEAIDEELERDERVFLMGEDVQAGPFGVTGGLVKKYGPERIRNTPISEAGFVGAGLGPPSPDPGRSWRSSSRPWSTWRSTSS